MQVNIKLLDQRISIPVLATDGSAAFDLAATCKEAEAIFSGEQVMIGTGIALSLPKGYCARVLPRSGLGLKGLDVHHGLIDSDYRGEVKVMIRNLGEDRVVIKPLDRIAQLLIQEVPRVEFVAVENLDDTARGQGGFGSTGVSHV